MSHTPDQIELMMLDEYTGIERNNDTGKATVVLTISGVGLPFFEPTDDESLLFSRRELLGAALGRIVKDQVSIIDELFREHLAKHGRLPARPEILG